MQKHTKKALILSVLSLVLCVSMLVGTTFAWFTDSVTTGVNTIQSGTLDIALEYSTDNGATWADAEGKTLNFMAADGRSDILWEPGCTYKLPLLRLRNNGNLALKYTFVVNGVDGDAKLLEAIEWTANEAPLSLFSGELKVKDEVSGTIQIQGHMKESAGNEYQGLSADGIGITVFATQLTYESDSFNNQYDANAKIATTAAEAQAILDNAVPGTTLYLTSGVNYGVLYLRPSPSNAATKAVDWIGNNYGYETYSLFEDITIVGAKDATVDALVIEGNTYYKTAHSQAADYPVMLSLIELKNFVVDGVTFTGKGGYDPQGYGNAINLSGSNIKVDGLTVKNCVLDNADNNARLIYKTESTSSLHRYAYDGEEFTFTPSLKDITVTNTTFNGGYMGLELRETENLTITNNVFNVADRNILLSTNSGYTYSGTVTITGNVSNNAKERFVRADGMGDAVVVITDNTLNGYMGADKDYIKVTNANNVTIKNNTLASVGVSDSASLSDAIADGATAIVLGAGEYKMPSAGTSGDIAITGTKDTVLDVTLGAYVENATMTIEGVTIKTSTGKANGNGSDYAALYSKDVTYKNCTFVGPMRVGRDGAKFIDCTFTALGNDYVWTYGNDVSFEGCTFNTDGKAILIYSDGGNEVAEVSVKDCVFNATAGAKAGAIANQNCAAIEIHNYGNGVNLVTENNTYDDNFSGEWRIKTYEAGRPKVIVNGVEYKTIAIDGKNMTIDSNKNVTVA